MNPPSVSLVLGSGGARGLAHIGVIEWLEQRGFHIRCIAGTSMGALVGGIYATGRLGVYSDWVRALQRVDVLRLLDLSLSRHALFKGERIIGVLREMIGEHDIGDLPVTFTAVATDIERQREVWLNRGPLFDAIRASIAVPMVFSPVRLNGRLLVDGGVVNPMPIAPALNDDTDLIIAVNLGGHAQGREQPGVSAPITSDERARAQSSACSEGSVLAARIRGFIDSLWPEDEPGGAQSPDLVMLMSRSMDCMQTTITRLRLAATSPDLVVEIPRDLCGFFEFYRAHELIEFGRAEAERQLGPVVGHWFDTG